MLIVSDPQGGQWKRTDLKSPYVEDLAHRRVEDLAYRRGDLQALWCNHEVGTGLQPCPLSLLPPSDSPITSPPNHNNLLPVTHQLINWYENWGWLRMRRA